jgi:hypothetical protein
LLYAGATLFAMKARQLQSVREPLDAAQSEM